MGYRPPPASFRLDHARENDAVARQAKVLTMDEARRGASNIAKLPKLLD